MSYPWHTDLNRWRQLFRSDRPKRNTSLMKPSEWEAFKDLPERIQAYRAHQPGETDWISYTLNRQTTECFASERGAGQITEYELHKRDAVALFLRRHEQELIVLNPNKAKKIIVHKMEGEVKAK